MQLIKWRPCGRPIIGGRPTNKAFHDLTTEISPPPNLRSLLGLGLKFIPTPYNTTSFNSLYKPSYGIAHIERSLRLHCFFLHTGKPPDDTEFNEKLHVPSDWNPPDRLFPTLIQNRLKNFTIKLYQLFKRKKNNSKFSKTPTTSSRFFTFTTRLHYS